MANLVTVELSPRPYGDVTREKLRDVMDCRGENASGKIAAVFGDVYRLCVALKTDENVGITGDADDLAQRQAFFGRNVIDPKKPKSIFKLIYNAMFDVSLIVLQLAALISFILAFVAPPEEASSGVVSESHANWIEGVAIMVTVILVVFITAWNDYKKENQFQALKNRIDKEVRCAVIRGGKAMEILITDLVVGDICQIKYGDLISADGILLTSNDLMMDESTLTGESDHVRKDPTHNLMIFSGTHVMEGSGRMVVTAVGVSSQAGIIMKLLGAAAKTKKEKFQQRKDKKDRVKAAKKAKKDGKKEARRKHKGEKQDVASTSSSAVLNADADVGNSSPEHFVMGTVSRQSGPPDSDEHTDAQTDDEMVEIPLTEQLEHHGGMDEVEESKDGEKSVLQAKLSRLSGQIGYAGMTVAVLTVFILWGRFAFDTYYTKDEPFITAHLNYYVKFFIIGITVLVVAIPEGLPLAVTISLACSVQRMTKDNNLVRHLDACETMGNATTICSDKTGTLTTNRMTAVEAYVAGIRYAGKLPKFEELPEEVALTLVQAISINSSYTSRILPPDTAGDNLKQVGNKTECALLGLVQHLGKDYEAIREEIPEDKLHKVYTFNSARKSMSTVVRLPGGTGFRVFTKGASEIVLKRCTFIYGPELQSFSSDAQEQLISTVLEPMACDGLRTICVAYKDYLMNVTKPNEVHIENEPDWEDEESVNSGFTCLAIIGIEDPVRPEVPEAIRQCQEAGITVRMVTGDNVNTARSIALKCDIISPEGDFLVLDGTEFNNRIRDTNGTVQQHLFDQVWPRLRVLARSSPADKYILVKHIIESKLNSKREVVAVTGDGTNDGPALKKADVGFAMGIAGTDVAKEASDIIITDDNFSSIVKAVMWGRNVYDSIAKFLQFQLTVNVVAVIVAFVGACTIEDSPLKAVQMLWVNLIMDSFASVAMAYEALSPGLLKRHPYGRNKALISQRMMVNILGQALYQLTVIFCILFFGERLFGFPSGPLGRIGATEHFSFVFNAFVFMTIFNEINCRKIHGERNIFAGLSENPCFCVIIIGSIIVQVVIFVVPFCNSIFNITPLSPMQWFWCIMLGFSVLIWNQFLICIPAERIIPEIVDPSEEDADAEKKVGHKGDDDRLNESEERDIVTAGTRVLWFRGFARVQQQIRVVNAFKSELKRGPTPDMARFVYSRNVTSLESLKSGDKSSPTFV